jgi:cyclic di-GMP phosphodiesterase Gmr
VDTLKIDRAFVTRLDTDPRAGEMVRMIVTLAAALGKSVVAEGVENPEQAERLKALGCGHVQGYLYSRPLSVEAADPYIAEAARRDATS